MRVMVLVKATKDSEAGTLPSTKALEAMGKYNEALFSAGMLLAERAFSHLRKGSACLLTVRAALSLMAPSRRPES